MLAKRIQPVDGRDDVSRLLVKELVSSASRGIRSVKLPARPTTGHTPRRDVLQRTEIALVHHEPNVGEHFFGGRVATGRLSGMLEPSFELASPDWSAGGASSTC